ncbi:hypothetical protein BV22DRAFT_1035737 [Leucogyrophana mollusca]|uniref:Uncharacterized protein n=1 Tax=Leucogyrophana mollusca TaxID=85980 RepID=A0ACB8BE03_9AGAM|nr:hypothetical protein BV22DRAFT_1035737 [Leucogyrophana mollusca]
MHPSANPVYALEHTRTQIDAEIIAHFDAIHTLRVRRNSLAPISSLPPELLAAIFVECVNSYHSQPTSFHMWIRVAHVCRHWRDVALACPALWNHLVFGDPAVTEIMITRSKLVPLVIRSDFVTSLNYDGVQVALRHTARAKDLHLVATEDSLRRLLNDIKEPAPLLESLSLKIPRSHTFFTLEAYKIPEAFLGGMTPRLRKLVLYKCELAWDSPILGNLIHLDISGTVSSGSPTLAQVLAALARMQALESLSLADIIPLLPMPPVSYHKPVALSRLRHISLKGEADRCAQLLAHLTYPRAVILKLACTTSVIHGPDFSSIFPFVSAFEPSSIPSELRLHSASLTNLCIQLCKAVRNRVSMPTDSFGESPSERFEDSDVHFELNLSWAYMSIDQAQRLAVTVCGQLPTAGVRSMHLYGIEEAPDWFWEQMSRQMPALNSMFLRDVRVGGLIHLLRQREDEQPKMSGEMEWTTVPLPGLREITLEQTLFRYTRSADAPERMDAEDLVVCLKSRSSLGSPLRKLTIQRCVNIFQEQADMLKEAVEDFIWDGHEEEESDGSEEPFGESPDSDTDELSDTNSVMSL